MILLIDNYDSFVYNLARYVEELGYEVRVIRNDAQSVASIRALRPDAIIISPGPCTPNEAGVTLELIEELKGDIPLLGVCLGHQAIGQVYGGVVARADKPVHGKTSQITHDEAGLFDGLQSPMTVTRYHSLIVELDEIESPLNVQAKTADGEIMALRHKDYPVFGVQFHPESILTEHGHALLSNFLKMAKATVVS